jgi:chitin disaccharide deacetylase
MAMGLIINADDVAHSVGVNDATFDLMEQGLVTSATILANGPAFTDAVARASRFGHCSFGIHLNVSEFEPLTKSRALGRLLDADGQLIPDHLRRVPIDGALRAAIFDEWDAQVERVKGVGVAISHIDSHYHSHTIARLFPTLKRLQRKHGLTKVRLAMNLYRENLPGARSMLWRRRIWNSAVRLYGGTVTTQGFTDLSTFYETGCRRELKHSTFELMVHPGNPENEPESTLLRQGWRDGLRFKTDLITYHHLN